MKYRQSPSSIIQTRVKSSGPKNAKIAVVGMAPAKVEVQTGTPFSGPSGQILNEALSINGVSRKDVFVTNILEFPVPIGDSIYNVPRELLNSEIERLWSELESVSPNVIILLGGDPLQVVCGKSGIQKWRGSILSSTRGNFKCVPSVHPAWILRGMYKWLPIFRYIDIKRAIDESSSPIINPPEYNCITGPSPETIFDYIDKCNDQERLSFDIETIGHKEIACVGIGYKPSEALCIPFAKSSGIHYWPTHIEALIWRKLANLLQNPNVKKIAQNAAFEWLHFWRIGIFPSPLYIDTMHLHHCLYPDFGGTEDIHGKKRFEGEPGHGLAFITSQYTKMPYYKDDGRKWTPQMGDHAFWEYNCKDVMVTLEAAIKMEEEARDEGVWDFYKQYYIKPFYHSLRMEWFGVGIDLERRKQAGEALDSRAVELQLLINKSVGYPINVASHKQMAELLYVKRKYQVKKSHLTGRPTADKSALQYFADKHNDQVLLWILELRQNRDLKGDIIDQELGVDGRMHCHYKIGGTDSGRWSSTKSIYGTGTNLQNIPREGIARSLFIPS